MNRDKKKSVVVIGTRGYPSYYGGFETAIRKLAPYLVDEGWDVTVYGRKGSTSTNGDIDRRVRTRISAGLETKSLSTLSYGFTSSIHAAITKPDVAIVMNVANGFFLPLLKLRGIPTLVNVDGIEWDRAKWGRFAKAMFRAGAWFAAKFGTRLVFDAKEIGNRWRRDFNVDGEFIPYGGDVPPASEVEDGLRHRGYILVVARFVPENTIPEFVRAAKQLAKKWPIVIVGSSGYGGEIDREVKELADKNPSVKWLGHLSDDRRLLALWQHAGVYFHGHSVGGTNPALVQAMACAAPIVARDTVYNREVLQDSAIFAAPDEDSIVAAIDALMSNDAQKEEYSERSFARRAEEYTWERVCGGYNDALNALTRNSATTTHALSQDVDA